MWVRQVTTFSNNSFVSVIYSSFSISNEATQFTLSVSGYIGVTGMDAFTSDSNGMKFSTLDHDNDDTIYNLAAYFKTGWWLRQVYALSALNEDYAGHWIQPWVVASSRMAIKQI